MPQILGYVVIGAEGKTYLSSGVSKVEHLGTGLYHITFDFSVANACEIASIGHWQQAAWITAYGNPPAGPNVIEVMMGQYAWSGGALPDGEVVGGIEAIPADLTFQLLVVA